MKQTLILKCMRSFIYDGLHIQKGELVTCTMIEEYGGRLTISPRKKEPTGEILNYLYFHYLEFDYYFYRIGPLSILDTVLSNLDII